MPVRVETYAGLDEAARSLAANSAARFFAGGTLLMRAVNEANPSFDTLIRATDPALKDIRPEGDAIVVGAACTMNEIMAHRELAFLAPVARGIGGPAVRTAATIGGNLFARSPFGEMTTALLALGATIHFAGHGDQVVIDEFLSNRDRYRNQIVRSVSVPRISDPSAFRFLKVTRVKPKGAALISIAARIGRPGGGETRIAFNNMNPVPTRALAAEQALQGGSLDEASVSRAASLATDGMNPPTDALASDWYRREVAPVHLRRLLLGRA
ncbi:FAD binding domain-containing protein [Microbaculum sp. FT89]|uniref:FAD binding domain-containing protein n=1 Tax=Microbaculum sp. FT89 TaxID=3447298 RepID=UPI003F533D91